MTYTPKTVWIGPHPYPPPEKAEPRVPMVSVKAVREAVRAYPGHTRNELRHIMNISPDVHERTFASALTKNQQLGFIRSTCRYVKHRQAPPTHQNRLLVRHGENRMSFGPKSRTHRINYAKIIERAHRPHPDMRIFSPNEVPADPRAAKVLRVNPYRETTYLHSNRLPLGELVAPEVPPGVAQPARDNVMERPVYVPPKRGYVRGQA